MNKIFKRYILTSINQSKLFAKKNSTRSVGAYGETLALQILTKEGYICLERNFQCRMGEIDLIMRYKDTIVFTEVRLRQNTLFGNGLESVNHKKIKKIIQTATNFLQVKKWLYKVNTRFDIIAIHPSDEQVCIEWYLNAFN